MFITELYGYNSPSPYLPLSLCKGSFLLLFLFVHMAHQGYMYTGLQSFLL